MKSTDASMYDQLIRRYPHGYTLFMIHRKETVIPYESRLNIKCKLDWSNAKIYSFTDNAISIQLPDIICDPGPKIIGCRYILRRITGNPVRVFGRLANIWVQMYLELLVDSNEKIVCVLGFADN
jgi:hypothetical protein